MGLRIFPVSPNNHPTTAQGSPEIVGAHPKFAIFQPKAAWQGLSICYAMGNSKIWFYVVLCREGFGIDSGLLGGFLGSVKLKR